MRKRVTVLEEKIQKWIERMEFQCPGCGLNDEWDFDRTGVVVTLPEKSLNAVGIGSLRVTSFSGGNVEAAMQKAIEDLQNASRANSNKVVKLPCGNCGYILFLDSRKVL